MKELLVKLNELNGIQGCMVITHDGIMVASELGGQLDEETVAALSSSLVITLQRAFEPVGQKAQPQEMILTAELGKLAFFDLGRAYLVVVTKPQLRLGTDLVEIRSYARKLQSKIAINT